MLTTQAKVAPKKRVLMKVGATVAAAALLLSGCAQSQRDGAGSADTGGEVDGTFVFAASSDPKSLDPAFASDGESFRVSRNIFEGLIGVKAGTADPEPLLAESWEESEDGLSYTFALKEGVKFQDDTDFNAEAVCANFERWYNFTGIQQAETMAYYYSNIFRGFSGDENAIYESCSPNGTNEVTVNLAKPFAGFIASLSLPAFSMQSPTAMDTYGANVAAGTEDNPELSEYAQSNPVGTGPYKFDSWNVGQQVELSTFDGYWGDKGQVNRVIFRIIDDPTARKQALQAGEIDGYDLVAPSDVQALKDEGFNVVDRQPFNILYLGMNQAIPELSDPKVRQAIAYAIDKEALVSQTLPEGTKVATQFVPDMVNGYNPNVTSYDYDPDMARQLLAEAGYPDGITIDFNYPTGVSRPYMPTPTETFTAISAMLNEVGITTNPVPDKWSPDYLDKVQGTETEHGLHLLGWTGDYNDTDNFIGVFFGQKKMEWGFDDPALFTALSDARGMKSLEEQLPVYQQINDDIMKLLPGIPLASPTPSLAFAERVQSYPASPVNDEVYNLITLSE